MGEQNDSLNRILNLYQKAAKEMEREDKHLRECERTYCIECESIRAKRKGEK